VKYRQHKLSALIDTGSDISIAGEDIARNLGWTIHAHHIKEVSVANNKTMSIHGAARVILDVAGHDVESEILIAPDLDGLILGIDWLRSQGRIRWDFDRGKIKFGRRNWVELQRETEQPCRTSIIRKDFSMETGSALMGQTSMLLRLDQFDDSAVQGSTGNFFTRSHCSVVQCTRLKTDESEASPLDRGPYSVFRT